MPYPINYDFGKNWKTKIKPHLDNPKVKKAIRKGINSYLKIFPTNRKYKSNTIPATYSSRDGYVEILCRKEDELLKELREAELLPKKFLRLEKKMKDNEDDDYDSEYMEMREEILEPYFTWEKIKHDLEYYAILGSYHWTAPTFGLTLAQLVEPEENWYVRSNDKHTTIINEDETKIFDLLYWCSDNRLNNHVFGDPITKKDRTRGGKNAYIDSAEDAVNTDDD